MNNPIDSQMNSVEQILLKKTENSSTFLEAIAQNYQMRGIGDGLSFAEVEAY
jgi:hypothetical protein